MAIAISHFDTLEFVKKSKEYGIPEQAAEFQARQIEQAIAIAVNTAREQIRTKELVTKHDLKLEITQVKANIKEAELRLQKEIEQAKNQLLLWMFGMLTGFSAFIIGIMAKGFHWW